MRLAPATLVALVGLLLLASPPLASQDAVHGIHNPGPDGTSHLRGEAHVLHGSMASLRPAQDTLVVLGPQVPYSDRDIQHVRAFLEAGGRALVADDQGTGRDLLEGLQAGVHLAGVPVYTPVFDTDPASPIVHAAGDQVRFPFPMVLERPTAVLGSGEAVLRSDDVSWLDENANGRPDLGEPRDSYAFAMHQRVGAGELLVVGTPVVLDNAGHLLRDPLLEWIRQDGRQLVLDEGHHLAVDPVGMGQVLAGADWPWLVLPVAVLGVLYQTFQVRAVRATPRRRRRAVEAPAAILEELEP